MTPAQSLRKRMGEAERVLWRELRNRRFAKYKFRRQHRFAPYILDFFCADAQLAVEIDGGGHNEDPQREKDEKRTAFLNENGIEVIRFWNSDVLSELKSVLATIYVALENRSNGHPSP